MLLIEEKLCGSLKLQFFHILAHFQVYITTSNRSGTKNLYFGPIWNELLNNNWVPDLSLIVMKFLCM